MKLDTLFENFDLLMDAPNSIPEMRELILQLAVQGKLVPQDPNDLPASELLKQIKAVKARLVKEGKIKKGKPLPPVDPDEVPYELPEGWAWARLDEVAINVQYGYTAPANQSITDVRLLRITDIQNNRVDWPNVPGCNIDKNNFSAYELHGGDILIARTGGTIGKSYLVDDIPERAVFASYLIRIVPSSEIPPNYLKLFIESPLYWKQLMEKSSGTGQPNVNGTSLRSLILPLPPKKEQKRIVAKVDQLMALCDELETRQQKALESRVQLNNAALDRLLVAQNADVFARQWKLICENFDLLYNNLDNVNKLRQAILQLAVQGKLVPQDPNDLPASDLLKKIRAEKEWLVKEGKIKKSTPLPPVDPSEVPYELPEGWEWVRLGELVTFEYGKGLPKSTKSNSGKVPVYGANGIKKFYNNFLVQKPCIIVGRKGSAGALNRVYEPCWPLDVTYYVVPSELLDFEFIFYLLKSLSLEKLAKGIKPGLNRNEAYDLLVGIPPQKEQKRIVAKVDQLMALCDKLETRIKQTQEDSKKLLEAVLQEAMAA